MISAFGVEHGEISKEYKEPKRKYGLRDRLKASRTLHQNRNNPQFQAALRHQMAVNQVKSQLQKNPNLVQTGPRSFERVKKGLPRYLKDISPNIGASPSRTFHGGRPLSRSDHVYLRVRAHQSGKEASRANAEWAKIPKTLENGNLARSEEKWRETHRAGTKGRMAREGARKAIKDNTYTRPKKQLP